MSKLLTVVMPCYNVEQYLKKGLDSFADERLKEGLEVLIVNDGSTDKTAEIAEAYQEKYPEIFRVIYKENGGHGSGINTGLAEAAGKYFRVVDGDDWVHTENFVLYINQLAQIDSDAVVDKKREVDMQTGKSKLIPLPKAKEITVGKEQKLWMLFNILKIDRYYSLHTICVKTQLLRDTNLSVSEHVFYEDSEYVMKALLHATTVTFLDLEIYQYLIGNVNQSVSTQNFVKRYADFDAVTKEMMEYMIRNHYIANFTGDDFESAKRFCFSKSRTETAILTQYYIGLIYNPNRKEGKKQIQEFRKYLQKENQYYYKTTKKRYYLDRVLHALGVNYKSLQVIRKILGKA